MKPRRLFTIALSIGLLAFYAATWKTVRTNLTDFPSFYIAARLFQARQNPYDLDAECREQKAIRTDLWLASYKFGFHHASV